MRKIGKVENIDSPKGSLATLLSTLFPPFLLALIFFPGSTGLFIHPQLVDFFEPFLILSYTLVLMLIRYLSGKNVFYYVATVWVFINGFIMLMHWLMLKGPMTVSSLFVVFNTNYDEAVSFFKLKNSASFLLLIPFFLLFLFSLRYTFRCPRIRSKRSTLILYIISLVVLVFIGTRIGRSGFRAGTPLMARTSVLFYKEVSAFDALKRNTSNRIKNIRAEAANLSEKQVYVLIQGESANRNHLSLYGYYRDTSPHLAHFDNLMVFNNVVSAYTMTLESMSAELTEAGLENNKKSYDSYNLMDVFRSAGFKTYWISNQSPLGIWDNVVTLLAQQSDVTQFVNVTGNDSNDALSKASDDSKLFEPFRIALSDTASGKFIVLHLMGSHATYAKRYPPEFDVFKGKSEEEKTIAAYDNSILYSDFVVDSLLRILQTYSLRNDAVTSAVYLSDHGENVYDDADYVGHDYTLSVPKSIVEIPFMVWLSPEYRKSYLEKSAIIESRRTVPFVSDDLFHTFLDLSNINTEILNPEKSFFNSDYNLKRKRILADGKDYDTK